MDPKTDGWWLLIMTGLTAAVLCFSCDVVLVICVRLLSAVISSPRTADDRRYVQHEAAVESRMLAETFAFAFASGNAYRTPPAGRI
ncbi:hypothetical protein Q1695_002919 [Nippostrongylus brasiliensis]|nr:hypothetical protein Q1695_002919 [Nippostrongylus brasiliensis]